MTVLTAALFGVAGIGHAAIATALLNYLYGQPLPKPLLRLWRYATGMWIAAFPLLAWWAAAVVGPLAADQSLGANRPSHICLPWGVCGYGTLCLVVGGGVFPAITVRRWLRRPPPARLAEHSQLYDLGRQLGPAAHGDGKMAWAARLPFNDVFRLEVTRQTLAPPRLPAPLDGLTILVLADLHFHGTPSRLWFEHVLAAAVELPGPDLLCLLGDYVDADTHIAWIEPLLGRLSARVGKYAILGNHDVRHRPAAVQQALQASGYTLVADGVHVCERDGQPIAVVGHEGPWRPAPPRELAWPPGAFRLGLSHTPDQFYWAVQQEIDLLLCGHVHGGQIRLPLIGPIFVPSRYGRRFDSGVFQCGGTVMTVCRGLSGREPLRFRCPPQLLHVTLRRAYDDDQRKPNSDNEL